MRNSLAPFLVLLAIVFVSADTVAGEETLVSPSVIQPFEHSPDLFPIGYRRAPIERQPLFYLLNRISAGHGQNCLYGQIYSLT